MISEIRHKEREDCIRAVFFCIFSNHISDAVISIGNEKKSNQGEKKDEQKEH